MTDEERKLAILWEMSWLGKTIPFSLSSNEELKFWLKLANCADEFAKLNHYRTQLNAALLCDRFALIGNDEDHKI